MFARVYSMSVAGYSMRKTCFNLGSFLFQFAGANIDGEATLEMLWKDPVQIMHKVFQKKKNLGKIAWEPQNLRFVCFSMLYTVYVCVYHV